MRRSPDRVLSQLSGVSPRGTSTLPSLHRESSTPQLSTTNFLINPHRRTKKLLTTVPTYKLQDLPPLQTPKPERKPDFSAQFLRDNVSPNALSKGLKLFDKLYGLSPAVEGQKLKRRRCRLPAAFWRCGEISNSLSPEPRTPKGKSSASAVSFRAVALQVTRKSSHLFLAY